VRLYLLEAWGDSGEIIDEYSLRAMMESCLDFAEEETRLQQIAKAYDCIIKYTPKYHAEIAGVRIEYSWGQLNLTSGVSLSREKEQNNYSMMLFGKVWLFFPN
jgi:hypothetical protein